MHIEKLYEINGDSLTCIIRFISSRNKLTHTCICIYLGSDVCLAKGETWAESPPPWAHIFQNIYIDGQ